MANNNYKVTINLRDKSSFTERINKAPYQNVGAWKGDVVKFTQKKITIEAHRTSSKYKLEEILNNTRNSLHQQIIKSILYLYLRNGCRIRIKNICIDWHGGKKDEKFSYSIADAEQPLKSDFNLECPLPMCLIHCVWKISNDVKLKYIILIHWLSALSSNDRFYAFERYWRTFERLCFYNNRASKTKDVSKALQKMRDFICGNVNLFPMTLDIINQIDYQTFRQLDWEGYIRNVFPPSSRCTSNKKYENYKDNFVIKNHDHRIMTMLENTLYIRQKELNDYHFYSDIKDHLDNQIKLNNMRNEEVLCVICCRFAYYIRNMMFHGEKPDFAFTFSKGAEENKMIDFLNNILKSLTMELILTFDKM